MKEITPAPPATDSPSEPIKAVMAFNPTQMAEAQATTISWIQAKLASAQQDVEAAESTLSTLRAYGLRTETAERQLDKAARRVKFYEKVRAALDAGYYIIPPFNIQLFAIRTDRKPPMDAGRSAWVREQDARALPLGTGNFVNARVVRQQIDTEKEPDGKGGTRDVAIFGNTKWLDGIEIPARAMKPQIIDAVGKALQEKIFDALGIAPAYREADPIIAGQIKRPDGKGVLTFFVAWWLDEEDL